MTIINEGPEIVVEFNDEAPTIVVELIDNGTELVAQFVEETSPIIVEIPDESVTIDVEVADELPPVIVEFAEVGLVGPPGPPGELGIIYKVAKTDLNGYRVVVPDDAGLVYYADADTLSHYPRPVWLTINAWVQGENARLLTFGGVDFLGWSWTPGEPIYLGANGALTQTLPESPISDFSRQVAIAITETSIFFNPEAPILFE